MLSFSWPQRAHERVATGPRSDVGRCAVGEEEMARPSLAEVRIAQIVKAAARCIAANGYHGATLERIAAEAGFRRGHIRHYVGNRAELLDRVVDAVAAPYDAALRAIQRLEDPMERVDALLDHLFGPDWGPSEDTQVFTALLLGAEQDPKLRERMRALYERHRAAISDILRNSAPPVSRAEADAAAYAIVCLAYGNTTMMELALADTDPTAARDAAASLIATGLHRSGSLSEKRVGAGSGAYGHGRRAVPTGSKR
jgi:AcrR family transcriptional regulator